MKSLFFKKSKIAIVGVDWDIVDLIDSISELEIAGFFDPSPAHIGSISYLGNDDAWQTYKKENPDVHTVLALDHPQNKARLFEHYEKTYTLLSPHAYISKRSSLGKGTIVQRGALIMPNASLGLACKVNVNAVIHHDAIIGNFCTIAPGAQILGRVVLEDKVYVGAGAIIRQHSRIGTGALIGAGAVVVSDIPANTTVVGVPAKELKSSSS